MGKPTLQDFLHDFLYAGKMSKHWATLRQKLFNLCDCEPDNQCRVSSYLKHKDFGDLGSSGKCTGFPGRKYVISHRLCSGKRTIALKTLKFCIYFERW